MKVIVTGFNAFGDNTVNPSHEAVMLLPDIVKFDDNTEELRVAKLTLPTCCLEAWTLLSTEVGQVQTEPYAVILTGLADGRDKICLERFALNVRHFRIADNNGHQWDEEFICQDGLDALRVKLPLKTLCQHLNLNGFASDISNYAGTFVCNETYYRSLLSWQDDPLCRAVLFVHFPPYDLYRPNTSSSEDPRTVKEVYAAALKEILSYLLT